MKNTFTTRDYIDSVKENIMLEHLVKDLSQHNLNLAKTVKEIKRYINSEQFFIRMDEPQISVGGITKYELVKDDILQIIDKYLNDSAWIVNLQCEVKDD